MRILPEGIWVRLNNMDLTKFAENCFILAKDLVVLCPGQPPFPVIVAMKV